MGSIAGSIAGGIASSAAGSLFGKKPKMASGGGYTPAQFKPFTYRTSLGEAKLTTDPFEVTAEIDPRLLQMQEQTLTATGQLLPEYIQQLQTSRPSQLAFEYDPRAAQQQMFQEQAALLQPELARQRQQLQSDLFGSGRLGLMLAGEAAGAGAGGMVQPDAFGLGRAQSETLARLAASTRREAQQEQQTLFDQALRQSEFNERQRQQLLAQLQTGEQGLFQRAVGIADIESALQRQALDFESARAQAALGAYKPLTGGGGGLLSGIAQGAAPAIGQAVGRYAEGLFAPRENIPQLQQGAVGYNPAFTYNPAPMGAGAGSYYAGGGSIGNGYSTLTSGGFESWQG